MTSIEKETIAIEEKNRKQQEIDELKAEIQEVLLIIHKLQKTIQKLQKKNRIKTVERTEDEIVDYKNETQDVLMEIETLADLKSRENEFQMKCVEIDTNISWNLLTQLTKSNHNNLAKNDITFVRIVKSLFFPDLKSVSSIFNNKIHLDKWKEHIGNLKIIITEQKGISFGEYIFKENLRFSKDIYNFYIEICLFEKDLDEDHKRKVTRDFFNKHGSDVINNIKDRYDLSSEEAKVFTIYLACMSGFDKTVLGFDYSSMHEFFQNAWVKINNNQDEFRSKQQIIANNQKQIIHSDISRIKNNVTLGFDSYFTLFNQDQFALWFSEQKCGNGYTICKNYKNIDDELHKSIFNLAQKRTNKEFQNSIQKAGFTISQSIDFSRALFKRYTYYYDAMGNDFLQKMNFPKYKHDLIYGLEKNKILKPKKLATKVIGAAKNNHRLISLMQNGYTLDNNARVVNFIELTNSKKQSVQIFGEIFTFNLTKNKKGNHIISITGYSEISLEKLSKNDSNFRADKYNELNSIFTSISLQSNYEIKKMLASDNFIELLLSSYNHLIYDIYQYFTDSKNYVSFEKLKDGKTFVCSEIASEEISTISKWVEINQKLYSAIPYTAVYIWQLPFFGNFRKISRNNISKLNETKEIAFKKLFSYNDKEVFDFLRDISSADFSEEDYKERVKSKPLFTFLFSFLYLLKGNTWLRIRKNLFEQGDTLRSLLFLDENGIPIRIFRDDKELNSRENPYLNIKIDFKEIFSTNRLLDRNILSTFPISIKAGKSVTRYPELKFRFCRVDGKRAGEKGKKARELYIERIRENLGHIEEIGDLIDILYSKPALSFNQLRGENREIMMKIFMYLFFEYNEVWTEFSDSLMEHLNKNIPFTTENMVLSGSFVDAGWNISIKSIEVETDKKWLIHYVVEDKSTKVFERKVKILPAFVNFHNKNTSKEKLSHMKELTLFCNHNPLYLQVLAALESEIMPLVLINDLSDLDSEICCEWKSSVDWMEKACV